METHKDTIASFIIAAVAPPVGRVVSLSNSSPSPLLHRRDDSQLKRAADDAHVGKACQEPAKTETDVETKMAPHQQDAGLMLQVNTQPDGTE